MKIKHLYIFIFLIIFSSVISVLLMQTPGQDFYGHHYYNGWAFLNNRLNTDFLACLHRTYYNPIFDAFNYVLITKLNGHLFLYNILQHCPPIS